MTLRSRPVATELYRLSGSLLVMLVIAFLAGFPTVGWVLVGATILCMVVGFGIGISVGPERDAGTN